MNLSVRASQGQIKHQHDRPTCVAFAVTALHEHRRDVLNGLKEQVEIDLSEEYLHYHCKHRDGLKLNSSGTTMNAAAASLAVDGQSLEHVCPYQTLSSGAGLNSPSPLALADGKTRLLPGLQLLALSIASIQGCLGKSEPVIAVLDWYSNSYLAPLGRIDMPGPFDLLLGRHAVLVVELENESQPGSIAIGFRNSWGPKWGDKGYGYFGANYFSAYGRELWGLIS
jgi:C1A family cysteine protease